MFGNRVLDYYDFLVCLAVNYWLMNLIEISSMFCPIFSSSTHVPCCIYFVPNT